jgi:hypothetical protein
MEAFAGEVFVGCAHELAELGRAIDSAELAPPRSGMSAVVLTGRAICVPFRARRLRFATVNHGHS